MILRHKLILAIAFGLFPAWGMAQSAHSVTLTWTASPDAAANPTLSYNVYRSVTSCSSPVFSKVGSVASGVLTFQDTAVTVGNTYCYAVTSVLNGLEGNNSPVVQAVILPAPPPTLVETTK